MKHELGAEGKGQVRKAAKETYLHIHSMSMFCTIAYSQHASPGLPGMGMCAREVCQPVSALSVLWPVREKFTGVIQAGVTDGSGPSLTSSVLILLYLCFLT